MEDILTFTGGPEEGHWFNGTKTPPELNEGQRYKITLHLLNEERIMYSEKVIITVDGTVKRIRYYTGKGFAKDGKPVALNTSGSFQATIEIIRK